MKQRFPLILSFLMIAALLVGCASGVASAQGATPTATPGGEGSGNTTPRTISVSGSGRAFLTPDIAYVTIGVHTEGKDASEAVSANNTESQKVVDAIRAAGVEAKDIMTNNFSIYPQQQYDLQGKPTGEITYMVDNSVYVTVRDLEELGDLLDTAVRSGANSINGIQFDVADKTEALSGARQEAVTNARTIAQEMAEAAGVELGEIQSISVYGGGYPSPMPMYDRAAGGAMAQEASVPINPGQMTLTVDVSVVFAIR